MLVILWSIPQCWHTCRGHPLRPELSGRETKALIDGLKASYSAVIDGVPNLMSLGSAGFSRISAEGAHQ